MSATWRTTIQWFLDKYFLNILLNLNISPGKNKMSMGLQQYFSYLLCNWKLLNKSLDVNLSWTKYISKIILLWPEEKQMGIIGNTERYEWPHPHFWARGPRLQKVNTTMSSFQYYSSQKKCTNLQIILYSSLVGIWTLLSSVTRQRSHCSGVELVTGVSYFFLCDSSWKWVSVTHSKMIRKHWLSNDLGLC